MLSGLSVMIFGKRDRGSACSRDQEKWEGGHGSLAAKKDVQTAKRSFIDSAFTTHDVVLAQLDLLLRYQ